MQETTTPSLKRALGSASTRVRAEAAVQAAIEKKAERLLLLDLEGLSSFADHFVIASGTSVRQVQAIAESIVVRLKAEGLRPLSIEGQAEGRWIVIDYGDLIAHVFLDSIRDFYRLEELWTKAKRLPIPTEWYLAPSRAAT